MLKSIQCLKDMQQYNDDIRFFLPKIIIVDSNNGVAGRVANDHTLSTNANNAFSSEYSEVLPIHSNCKKRLGRDKQKRNHQGL